ncbi:hypothetical protein ACWKXN_06470 [Enterobacter sp. UPMP2060]
MTIKSQLINQLQVTHTAPVFFASNPQVDIQEFCLRMTQLQERMNDWLMGVGMCVETLTVSVTNILEGGGVFDITALIINRNGRSLTFTPVFLPCQGMTWSVETTLHVGGLMTSQGRLFIRGGHHNDWMFSLPGALSRQGQHFDEGTFFCLILALLP